jgi:hypothetical protein
VKAVAAQFGAHVMLIVKLEPHLLCTHTHRCLFATPYTLRGPWGLPARQPHMCHSCVESTSHSISAHARLLSEASFPRQLQTPPQQITSWHTMTTSKRAASQLPGLGRSTYTICTAWDPIDAIPPKYTDPANAQNTTAMTAKAAAS